MSLGLCGSKKLRKKLTMQMLGSTQASEPPQLPTFKIQKPITTTTISSFNSELEAGNKSPKFLKLCKVRKWNKLPFFVPFQEIFPPCSSIAAVFKIHRDLRSNHSQSVKRKILRRLRWNWTWLQRAGQKGGALALMLQRLVAARVAAGTLLSARHPASAREYRGRAVARPKLCPPPPRLLPPDSPRHPSARGLRARLPAQRWLCGLGAADSRTHN